MGVGRGRGGAGSGLGPSLLPSLPKEGLGIPTLPSPSRACELFRYPLQRAGRPLNHPGWFRGKRNLLVQYPAAGWGGGLWSGEWSGGGGAISSKRPGFWEDLFRPT